MKDITRRPFTPCKKPNCPNLTRAGYCTAHEDEAAKNQHAYNTYGRNQIHKKFYNSKEWQAARRQAIIRDHNLCQQCLREGRYTNADVVDHIVELQDNYALRTTLDNLECLCHSCHNIKTQQERQRRRQQPNHPFGGE